MGLPKTIDVARGKWVGILKTMGVDARTLKGVHCPCPFCGGRDRFRFDNKDGNGTYICNQCGSGDGIGFVMSLRGLDYGAACSEVDAIVGNKKLNIVANASDAPRELSPEQRRQMLRDLWAKSKPTEAGDIVHQYLASRGLDDDQYPEALRTAENCFYSRGLRLPAMVAIVVDVDGKPVNMHRTFIRPDGTGKADVQAPRKMMPGEIPAGACVRLGAVQEQIGIAEGIETAFAAMHHYHMPVWSAINSTMLAKWEPPAGVTSVCIFGDNDTKFGGQAAAYALAHKLTTKGVEASVHIPEQPGTDWADIPF